MSEQHDDELVTRSSAMTITWLRQNLRKEVKAAIKELAGDWIKDFVYHLIRSKWVRVLGGLLFVAGLIAAWTKERAG